MVRWRDRADEVQRARLAELARRLARTKSRKDRAGVEAEIAKIIRPRWVSRVITTTLTGDRPAQLSLDWSLDRRAVNALTTEILGRRVLFTDHDDWPVVDVVAAYRSQPNVEDDLRQMKDPRVVSFSPMLHWTDQRIRVHVLCCVLALAVARLMRREAANAGMAMSVRGLLAKLGGIEETVLLYPSTGGRPKARRVLTQMSPTQTRLYELFGLGTYAPKEALR